MNAPLPANATSRANQPASSERGIDRLFAEMAAMYGTKFADLWAGCDIESVKAKWVEKLRGFSDHPGVIQKAIDALDERPNPPTLPEFLSLCREAARRMGTTTSALPYKPTPEDEERARMAAASAAKVIKTKVSDGVDAHWATHPRSYEHLRAVFDAAAKDPRYQTCVDLLVKDGICTADGRHLLKSYRDGQWWPVHRRAA
jgi:hypothetical protein